MTASAGRERQAVVLTSPWERAQLSEAGGGIQDTGWRVVPVWEREGTGHNLMLLGEGRRSQELMWLSQDLEKLYIKGLFSALLESDAEG